MIMLIINVNGKWLFLSMKQDPVGAGLARDIRTTVRQMDRVDCIAGKPAPTGEVSTAGLFGVAQRQAVIQHAVREAPLVVIPS
jgi:hypothetical protein